MKINEISTLIGRIHPEWTLNDVRREMFKGNINPSFRGKIGNLFVYSFNSTSFGLRFRNYLLTKKKFDDDYDALETACGILRLHRVKNSWKAMEVDMSWLSKEIRGIGIGKKLYNLAIINDNIILVSGEEQTKDSKGLWAYFAKHPEKYTVWVQKVYGKNIKDREQVNYDYDERNIDQDQRTDIYNDLKYKRMFCIKK